MSTQSVKDSPKKDYSLGAKRRIKKRKDFLRIQNSGNKTRGRRFLLSYVEVDEADSKIGITVTKKVDKRAVVRNYLKRQIRDYFRHNRFRINKPVEVVIICLQGSAKLEPEQIRKELDYLFYQAKLYENNRPNNRGNH